MGRFRVHLQSVVNGWVDVEAEDAEAASELVTNGDVELPFAPAFADYEFGEWESPSTFDSKVNKPEDDVSELDE